MENPKLIMLCGIPTSGKSTYIQKNYNLEEYVVLSTDDWIIKQSKTLNKTYSEVFDYFIKSATLNLFACLELYSSKHMNLIWYQTNLTKKSRKEKLLKIPNNYKKIAIYFEIELDDALKRNKNRKEKHIPKMVLKTMHSSYERPTLDEGFDEVICGTVEKLDQ